MNYSRPTTPAPRSKTVPRTLTPLASTSEQSATPPALATINRTLLPGWTCSTHVFQAAAPRESAPPGSTARTVPPADMGKAERQALVNARFTEINKLRGAIASGSKTFPTNDATMWTVANRYAPDNPRVGTSPAVTMIFIHATGFHKEIWETTLKHLLSTPHGQAGIDEIWALDAVNHGDAGILNKDSLGEILEWTDNTRDILNFVANYLPDEKHSQVERSLRRIPQQDAQKRRQSGFKHRSIVGIGHSFGGTTLARAVIESSRLFSSLVLIDPVIYPSYVNRGPGNDALTKGALCRRDNWPNQESAKSSFLKSRFFQAWHPDVLADYLKYGTVEDEQGEAVTYGENSRLPCEVWELLPTLDERIPIKWVMDSTRAPGSLTGGPEHTRHTIPLEAPEALAREILDFIQTHHSVKAKL